MVDSQNRAAFCPLPWMRPLQEAQRIYLQAKRAGKNSHVIFSPALPSLKPPGLWNPTPGGPSCNTVLMLFQQDGCPVRRSATRITGKVHKTPLYFPPHSQALAEGQHTAGTHSVFAPLS